MTYPLNEIVNNVFCTAVIDVASYYMVPYSLINDP